MNCELLICPFRPSSAMMNPVMYEEFTAKDCWTGDPVHCIYQAVVVAVATRHADAVDIKFLANGKNVWICLPCPVWVEYQRLTGHTISDRLAVETAGRFLKKSIEQGYDTGREMYPVSPDETMHHVIEVLKEHGAPDELIPKLTAA